MRIASPGDQRFDDFIKPYVKTEDDKKEAKKGRDINKDVNVQIAIIKANKPVSGPRAKSEDVSKRRDNRSKANQVLKRLMVDLSKVITPLLDTDGADSDFGTDRSKPYLLHWPKRKAAEYPRFTLPPDTEPFSPLGTKKPLGNSGIALGLNSTNDLKVGQFLDVPKDFKKASDTDKNKVRRTLKKMKPNFIDDPPGTTIEHMQIDHVWEKQLGGGGGFDNLWPLDSSENMSSGSRLRSLEKLTIPPITKSKFRTKNKDKPIVFKITSTL